MRRFIYSTEFTLSLRTAVHTGASECLRRTQKKSDQMPVSRFSTHTPSSAGRYVANLHDPASCFDSLQTILHYMVSSGTGQSPARPSQGVLFLLERSGLMSGHGSGSSFGFDIMPTSNNE